MPTLSGPVDWNRSRASDGRSSARLTRRCGRPCARKPLDVTARWLSGLAAEWDRRLETIKRLAGAPDPAEPGQVPRNAAARIVQIEKLIGNVAIHATVVTKTTTPKPSSTPWSRALPSFVLMPAKNKAAANSTTPST